MDPTLDRLFRHMAWGNAYVFARLSEISPDAWLLTAPNNEWSVAAIAEHLAGAAGFYVTRLDGNAPASRERLAIPATKAELLQLAQYCGEADIALRKLASLPDAMTTYQRGGETVTRARSTILAQSIHHATEHRSQIAGVLSGHKINAIDLDEIDLWGLGDAEGLGE